MNDEVVLMKLRNIVSEKKVESNRLLTQLERVNAFCEAVQISIDVIERERDKAKPQDNP